MSSMPSLPSLTGTLGLLSLIAFSCSVCAAAEPARTFPVGTYRQNGTCIKLVQGKTDLTSSCKPFVGVVAWDDDRPRFVFSHGAEAWFFVASGPAVYARGNTIATYPVSHVYDTSVNADMLLEGECVVVILEGRQEISCTTWRQKEREEIAWEANFHGSGVWVFIPPKR